MLARDLGIGNRELVLLGNTANLQAGGGDRGSRAGMRSGKAHQTILGWRVERASAFSTDVCRRLIVLSAYFAARHLSSWIAENELGCSLLKSRSAITLAN